MTNGLSFEIGQRFGALTLLEKVRPGQSHQKFLFECDCGQHTLIFLNLITKRVYPQKSCGCRIEPKVSRNSYRIAEQARYRNYVVRHVFYFATAKRRGYWQWQACEIVGMRVRCRRYALVDVINCIDKR